MDIISSSNAPAAIGPYSQGIKTDHLIFFSGQIPLKPDGSLVTGSIEEQTIQVLENIKNLLSSAGSSFQKVVKTTMFLADMNDFAKVNEIYSQYFQPHKPARSTIQVARLPKDAKIEIECIALV